MSPTPVFLHWCTRAPRIEYSGLFLFNERERQAEHHVRFDVPELMRAAAKAVRREKCVNITKLAEGGFNKVFQLTMDDGYEVVARIPTPIAGPPHYTTASEVATMDFLRTELDIPVPKVFAWSSRVNGDDRVNAEYMIMEKVQGESLAAAWTSLSGTEIRDVMKQLVDIEARLLSRSTEVCIIRRTLDNRSLRTIRGSSKMEIFWTDSAWVHSRTDPGDRSEDYLTSIGEREAAWTARFGRPRHREFFFSLSKREIDPEEHLALLSQYDKVAPYLIPKQEDLTCPTLRHPDLHQSNIFICPQSKQILNIIDWQGASVLPFVVQAGYPALCDHDMRYQQSMQRPRLSDEFDKMSPGEQQEALMKLKHEQANLYYTAATGLKCKRHLRALRLPHLAIRQDLIRKAGMPWNGDLVALRRTLVEVQLKWDELNEGQRCPIAFSDKEIEVAIEEGNEWNEAAENLATIRKSLGIDEEGGVEVANYDLACGMNREWRLQLIRSASVDEREQAWRIWPYKDDNEDSEAFVAALKQL
ncbi:MAG: hypothetical protein M1836_002673 [Candelina mexicana]|nr:MAG: hypothetical protein M1836_002673 [Candelina mexicana]